MMLPSSLTSRPSAIVSPATRSPRMVACEARISISVVGVGLSTIEPAGSGVTTLGPVSDRGAAAQTARGERVMASCQVFPRLATMLRLADHPLVRLRGLGCRRFAMPTQWNAGRNLTVSGHLDARLDKERSPAR
jgi:hypothetical protein